MPFVAIVASRYAVEFEIVSGGSVETLGTIAWPGVTVDYANDGETDNPPTRVFVNLPQISYTGLNPSGDGVVVSLPLSNEAVFVRDDDEDDDDEETNDDKHIRCYVRWVNRRRIV